MIKSEDIIKKITDLTKVGSCFVDFAFDDSTISSIEFDKIYAHFMALGYDVRSRFEDGEYYIRVTVRAA